MGGVCTWLVPPSEAWGQDWKLGKGNSPKLICYPNSSRKELQGSPGIPNSVAGLSRKEHT